MSKDEKKGESLMMDEVPKGYLSIEEIAAKYPDICTTVERAVDAALKPTMKVMVYINEPDPIKARIVSKDAVETLPNKQPISMLAYDVLSLTGNPNYRFDLNSQPEGLFLLNMNWGAIKRQYLENNFRNSNHAGVGKKMARYTDVDYSKLVTKNKWWNKVPDIRVMIEANVVESVTPKVDIEIKVWEIMKRNNIQVKEKYSMDEKKLVANDLQQEAHVYGLEGLMSGSNSHAHMEYFMKLACSKHTEMPG